MSDLMIGLADVMRAEIKALDTIANNAANINTPGYRAEYAAVVYKNFMSQINNVSSTQIGNGLPTDNANDLTLSMTRNIQRNDGAVKTTGVASHVAIRGDAWFVVEKDGINYLTRNGKFEVDSQGQLKTSSGALVMGEAGPINGLQAGFNITSDGRIKQSQGQIQKLQIATTSSDISLTSSDDALYQVASYDVAEPDSFALMSGVYEISNGDTATDMVRLMQTTRHIETIQRSIAAYDQLMNVGINQLGK